MKGGKQPGAGRPKGKVNKKTIEKKIVEEELRQRVLRSTQALLNSQFTLAQGCNFLYKIETEEDEKGNKRKSKPILVTSQPEIEDYLAGKFEDSENYYYITTEKPENKAIDSLFDRTFGKAPQPLGGSEDLPPIKLIIERCGND